MTRAQEIEKAADQYAAHTPSMLPYAIAFRDGCRWADANPAKASGDFEVPKFVFGTEAAIRKLPTEKQPPIEAKTFSELIKPDPAKLERLREIQGAHKDWMTTDLIFLFTELEKAWGMR